MKKNYKSSILILSFLLFTSQIFAKTANYQSELYTINVNYNEKVVPGDAIFVKMKISSPKKKSKTETQKKASLILIQNKKTIENAAFYQINKKKNSSTEEMLSGLPISPWITGGEFSLKVIFSVSNDETFEFELPVEFEMREWNKETLKLDEKNSAIKTDTSPERIAQIEKLNNILFTVMTQDVYSLKKFIVPTSSTRYTAFFGDRRIYEYTNGKSSTSLHYGNDYGIPEGSEVAACADGKVVMAENRISTGWSIVIEHLPGLYSLYYHLSEMDVKEGDMIKQGQIIGKSGSTGLATGPHLHWEVRLNGSAVHPEFFLNNFTFDEE